MDPGRVEAGQFGHVAADVVAGPVEPLGLPQRGTLPGDPFGLLVDTARTWLIGKKRTFRFPEGDMTMVLTDISVQGSDLARFVGQYGQARILARDVEWGGYQFERMEIQVKNVHLRPGTRPVLVAAPVVCEGFMSVKAASRWLATISSQLELVLERWKERVPMHLPFDQRQI